MNKDIETKDLSGHSDARGVLVLRSNVPECKSHYSEYREFLRFDFIYSCGYCSICETEAQGKAFQIDHYEPVSARPDLKSDYNNLIYSCDECNSYKNDVSPPEEARMKGISFFRPDVHAWDENFILEKFRVNAISAVGEFTSDVIRLNRQSLLRLREYRERAYGSHLLVSRGLAALKRVRLDHVPPPIRANILKTTQSLSEISDDLANGIDDILMAALKSPLLDPDDQKSLERSERTAALEKHMTLTPGLWRGKDHAKARK